MNEKNHLLLFFTGLPYLSPVESSLSLILSHKTRDLSTHLATFPLFPNNYQRFVLPCRVLTVGDGNLSFSLALCNVLRTLFPRTTSAPLITRLVATTFDDHHSLCLKYPESVHILEKLREKGAEVQSRINAIALPDTLGTFSAIVFNHPHLGVEDAGCHRILLAHFFHSSKERLRPNGQVFVSLVEGQCERWNLVEEAARAGFALVQVLPLDLSKFPEYEIKRTHSGRSFVNEHSKKQSNYSQTSTFYCFVKCTEACMYQSASRKKVAATTTTTTTKAATLPKRKRKRGGKQEPDDGTSGSSQHTCNQCHRNFRTKQGLKTHTHQVHVMKLYDDAKHVQCAVCARKFSSETSLQQHMLAKHGADQTIPPHAEQYASLHYCTSGRNSSSSSGGATSSFSVDQEVRCSVCRTSFADRPAYAAHFTKLEPIVFKTAHECSQCKRVFGDERALRQHGNFCVVKTKVPDRKEVNNVNKTQLYK